MGLTNKASDGMFMSDIHPDIPSESALARFPDVWGLSHYMILLLFLFSFFFFFTFLCLSSSELWTVILVIEIIFNGD